MDKQYIFSVCDYFCHTYPKCMCHIMLSSVTCLAVWYFPTLSHTCRDFWIKLKCIFWFSLHLLKEKFLIIKRIHRYITRWFKYDRDWFVCKQATLRSSCAVRLVYTQISPGHIWTTLYHNSTWFHVLYLLLLLSGFNENWTFLTDFQKIHTHHTSWNLSSGSGVAPWGQTLQITSCFLIFHKSAQNPTPNATFAHLLTMHTIK